MKLEKEARVEARSLGSEVMTIMLYRGDDIWIRVMTIEMERSKWTSDIFWSKKHSFYSKEKIEEEIFSLKKRWDLDPYPFSLPFAPKVYLYNSKIHGDTV